MSLTQEQIKKLAENLSKITLNDTKITKDINSILEYIDLLNKLDTSWVEATVNVVSWENKLRKDSISKKIETKDLLACSNQKVISDQIAISNIMG